VSASGAGSSVPTSLLFHISFFGTPAPGTYTDTVTMNVSY
jgi:spore coat protein U-like protein